MNGYSWLRCLSTYFMTIADSGSVNVSVLPTEELLDSGSWDWVLVYRFILKQDYVTNLREVALLLPGDGEFVSSILLLP